MANITPMGKGWKRKEEIALELDCTKRTITNMVHRGELEKTIVEGTPWFRLPESGTEGKEGETIGKGARKGDDDLLEQGAITRNDAETETKIEGKKGAETERNPVLDTPSINFETLYLEEKQKTLEQRDEVRFLRLELAEQREESSNLRVSLTEAQTALVHVERDRDRLQVQNEALQRALEQRTIFQSLVRWLKSFWNK